MQQLFLHLLVPVMLDWFSCMTAHDTIKGQWSNVICSKWSKEQRIRRAFAGMRRRAQICIQRNGGHFEDYSAVDSDSRSEMEM